MSFPGVEELSPILEYLCLADASRMINGDLRQPHVLRDRRAK